jgi:hypothetical protein
VIFEMILLQRMEYDGKGILIDYHSQEHSIELHCQAHCVQAFGRIQIQSTEQVHTSIVDHEQAIEKKKEEG